MAINIMITDDHSMIREDLKICWSSTVISRLLLRQRMVRIVLIN